MVKVNANELVLVLYNTLDSINSGATKKRNLETVKVKLSDLLTIVHIFVLARSIMSINTTPLFSYVIFLVLLFSVERVSIYVMPLICHNGEYRTTS
jgi:integral membrane sensor domain MASE1